MVINPLNVNDMEYLCDYDGFGSYLNSHFCNVCNKLVDGEGCVQLCRGEWVCKECLKDD